MLSPFYYGLDVFVAGKSYQRLEMKLMIRLMMRRIMRRLLHSSDTDDQATALGVT